jgi:DUF971 family protein
MSMIILPNYRKMRISAVTFSSATPVEIRLRKTSHLLAVQFDDGRSFDFPFEYLRVYSPSADVSGHGPGQEVLQTGKEGVQIISVDPIGHYAVRLVFDDGHDTGLYTWKYLYELGERQAENWRSYLDRLKSAGYARSEASDNQNNG